mmetsp:Transcript_13206/g.20585  ORF Transcript_13206/g.20585 Transcript_13206/m.20585 type:complete len:136 (+) Transcript_13206:2683-3090(+)
MKNIEQHLQKLKNQMAKLMSERDEGPEHMDELRNEMQREGLYAYEKFITDKTRFNSKNLIVDAYEGVLMDDRQKEKGILNDQRFKEFEKNRPPQDKWYELKNSGFQKELYRNRVALKPNNSNAVYLENLQDKNLY